MSVIRKYRKNSDAHIPFHYAIIHPISLLIDIYKLSLMSSDLIFSSSSPTATDALKIPFPKRFQSFEAKETDNESPPNTRDKGTPRGKSGTFQVSSAVTDINSRSAELPPMLWAPTGSNNTLGVIRIPLQPFHTPVKCKCHDKSPDPYFSTQTLSISPSPESWQSSAKKWRPKAFDHEASSELEIFIQRSKES